MPKTPLFTYVSTQSRLWLPPLLDNLAALPATMSGGDGCSIFLIWGGKLQLAATTRREMKSRLFDPDLAYDIEKPLLRHAALEAQRGRLHPAGSFTGWVAAFDRVLNLKDQRDDDERRAWASSHDKDGHATAVADASPPVPEPIWSDRGRGYNDWARPFLAVPMRHNRRVYGVVRINSLRENAAPFTQQDIDKLLDFGRQLARFFVDHKLLRDGLEHYFRIFAAAEGDELARRITEAMPQLFDVECCSFFQRDGEDRFVLKHSSASEPFKQDPQRRAHFDAFTRGSIGNLYYVPDDRSKSGGCLKYQAPLLLLRDGKGKWTVASGPPLKKISTDAKGAFLDHSAASRDVHCELTPSDSKSLLLMPVRDIINPRMLAGMLRVVSTNGDLTKDNLIELQQFADGLAERLGETTRLDVQRSSSQQLIRQLGMLKSETDKWGMAARIIAEALDADAATIFVREGESFRSRPEWSHLNEEQIRRDPYLELDDFQHHHGNLFKLVIPEIAYASGSGRTGWVAEHNRILNLKTLDDEREVRRLGIKRGPFEPPHDRNLRSCELLDPGPFIAAPIALPGSRVDAIVRAMRSRRSSQGPFTSAHALIIGTCVAVLAGLGRTGASSAPRVVISFGSDYAKLRDQLCKFLNVWGIKPLHLGDRQPKDPGKAFQRLINQASAAIVLATPDEERRRGRNGARRYWSPSHNVLEEMGRLAQSLPKKTLVLAEPRVGLPGMNGFERVALADSHTIYPVLIDISERLRDWLNLAR